MSSSSMDVSRPTTVAATLAVNNMLCTSDTTSKFPGESKDFVTCVYFVTSC